MAIEFRKAQRKAVPMLISLAGPSGSGKTFSALLLAAGLAGKNGRVGFIDTENGRGEMYQDSPGILKVLRNSFDYTRFDPPFTPARYIEYITAAEQAGITVCVMDSGTHEWEGIGGCTEIAEKQKLGRMPNWAKAKMEHKKFVNHLLSTSMHLVICLRARDKVKVFKKGDAMILSATDIDTEPQFAERDCVVPVGLSAVAEKSFVFEMLLSIMLDERTHNAVPMKVPEPLRSIFTGKHLITVEDGERIRQWNETGASCDPLEQVQKRARTAAEDGMESYRQFWERISAADRKKLVAEHEENKRIAEQADAERKAAENMEDESDTSAASDPPIAITTQTPEIALEPPATDASTDTPIEVLPIAPEAASTQETANSEELPDAPLINEADKIEASTGHRPSLEDLRRQMENQKSHPKGKRK